VTHEKASLEVSIDVPETGVLARELRLESR
jgi:hypothetical protein